MTRSIARPLCDSLAYFLSWTATVRDCRRLNAHRTRSSAVAGRPRHGSCHFSPFLSLSRTPTTSQLEIAGRSFRYASPRLWNQLPDSFRQPSQSCLDSSPPSPPHPSFSSSPLSSSITPLLFRSWCQTYLFNKSFPP